MLASKNPLVLPIAVAALITVFPTACGPGKAEEKSDKPSADAAPADVAIDGKKVAAVALGETVSYAGQLREEEGGTTSYSESRAFTLDTPKTVLLANLTSTSLDCIAGDEYVGPDYMLLKIEGESVSIVRSTIQMQGDGVSIPATDLAQFPGALDAGTYVLTVDYFGSTAKECHVKGTFAIQ